MKQAILALALMMFVGMASAAGWVITGGIIVKPDGVAAIVVPVEANGPLFAPFSSKANCDKQRELYLLEPIKTIGSDAKGVFPPYVEWLTKQATKYDVTRCIQVQ